MVPGTVLGHLCGRPGRIVGAGEGDVVGNVDDRERPARLIGLVGAGVVEGTAVVKGHAAGGELDGDRIGYFVAPFQHPVDDAVSFLRQLDGFLAAEPVGAGHEMEAAVLHGDSVDGDPGGQGADRIHRPVGRILVPVGGAAVATGGFDHGVVVVDAHVPALRQPSGRLGQGAMEGVGFDGRIVGPEVDQLVEDQIVLLADVATIRGVHDPVSFCGNGLVDGLLEPADLLGAEELGVPDVAVFPEEVHVLGRCRAGHVAAHQRTSNTAILPASPSSALTAPWRR